MSVNYALSHEEAVGLAVDALDFPLDADEQVSVDNHMAWCASCDTVSKALIEDQTYLTQFDWGDDQQSGYEDDDDDEEPYRGSPTDVPDDAGSGALRRPVRDDDDDMDGDPTDDDGDDSARPKGLSEDADDASEDARGDDDDVIKTAPGSPAEGDAEDDSEDDSGSPVTVHGHESGDDELSEDDPALVAAQAEADRQAAADARAEDERLSQRASEIADDMSDEELGEQDEMATQQDRLVPACAADGVDAASGQRLTDRDRQEAERSVRAQDGVEQTKYGKISIHRSTRGIQRNTGNPAPQASPAAASAIKNAVLRSRGGHGAVSRHQGRGRLDSKGIHRVAERDPRLFKRVSSPSPTKLLVWVMVDCSGSMSGAPIAQAASVARALADASAGAPNIRLAVWGWSDPFTLEARRFSGAWAGVAKVWETGMPTREVDKLVRLEMGGTPDAPVLDWAWKNIKREVHGDERPVIFLCSDGFGNGNLNQVVAEAVKHGVAVRSVAIGQMVRAAAQEKTFGRGNYVEWKGSVLDTARPIAKMMLQLAAPRS